MATNWEAVAETPWETSTIRLNKSVYMLLPKSMRMVLDIHAGDKLMIQVIAAEKTIIVKKKEQKNARLPRSG